MNLSSGTVDLLLNTQMTNKSKLSKKDTSLKNMTSLVSDASMKTDFLNKLEKDNAIRIF